jgi:uncharacterized protein YndB with AHSA1/START domain
VSQRSVVHDTFVIERHYDATPERVFAAWADPGAKSRWFGGSSEAYTLDFAVGGREFNRASAPDGTVYTFDARYEDVVPDTRLVFTYFMLMDETRISVSVASVEFTPHGEGTQLVYTEHGAFLDGHDDPRQREQGTHHLLDALAQHLDAPQG